ncbi:hypothetical protein DYH09_16030 [bacterium CPR1]|nr:hypothetical protein [bacterium CPR1]
MESRQPLRTGSSTPRPWPTPTWAGWPSWGSRPVYSPPTSWTTWTPPTPISESAPAWPTASGGLARSGALLAFGSDAPVSDANPFYGMHGAICRQRPARMEQGAWYPAERLSLQETLTAYTLGAATAAGRQRLTGSLAVGKRADLAVLDRDLFEIDRQGIMGNELVETRVLLTMFDGQVVHREI